MSYKSLYVCLTRIHLAFFFDTRRVALNTGVNKSYLHRKFPALNYVTERVSQQCFDQQVSQGVTNVWNWELRTAEPAEPNKNHLF